MNVLHVREACAPSVQGRSTILLVDDEPALIDVLERYLHDDGYLVMRAADGPSAMALFARSAPDLVVLDIALPGFSGLDVLRRMREIRNVPVIVLTARVHEIDRIVGLELGADDYVGKPFSPREVVARIRSVLRRADRATVTSPTSTKRIGRLAIDRAGHEVRVDGKPIALTPTQFRILDVLASHVGQTLTRDQLLESINADGDVFDRTLDRHIANLRAKIEADHANPKFVITVFGVGYKMLDPV